MQYRKYIKVFDLNDGVPKSKRLSPSQKLVYGYFHSWWESHQTGNKEKYETIAENIGIARSTFAAAIVKLEDLGWIAVAHGARISETKNECNTYQVARMPDKHIKHTKKKIIVPQLVIETPPEKTPKQIVKDTKYAMLAMAKGKLDYSDYQKLKNLLQI